MTQQVTDSDLMNQVVLMIAREKISSVSLMAKRTGVSHGIVLDVIKRATEEGLLKGTVTPDQARFFSGDIRTSDAPVVSTQGADPEFSHIDTTVLRYSVVAGVIMMIGGAYSGGLAISDWPMEASGSAISALGFFVIVAGCLYTLSREG